MGRGYVCWRKPPDKPRCRGRVINAYVREGTHSKWRVVGKVCNKCYAFYPLSATR